MRRPHDLGGLDLGPITKSEGDPAPWERRTDAIVRLLGDPDRQLLTVDQLRRGIEDLGPGAYEDYGYFERWVSSLTNILLEKGIFTVDELGRKMAEVEARWQADGWAPAAVKPESRKASS